jgi:hypothetical protein
MVKYFMERIKQASSYEEKWLEVEKPQPLSDNKIEQLIQDVLSGCLDKDISDKVYTDFKKEMTDWLAGSTLNKLVGFDSFDRLDIINGCTQFIDAIYMKGPVQTIRGDYRYHKRLNPSMYYSIPGYLKPGVPLIIAMPFPSTGAVHEQMDKILNESRDKDIDVHIDGAWVTCCKRINFDVSHSAIKSVGISLSKGLGLGWNRIGLRWTRQPTPDSVTIMNDFRMNNRALVMIGLHFLRNLEPDYLWKTHGDHYYKVCADFALTPTKSVYLALKDGQPVGISPLLRYLENANIS